MAFNKSKALDSALKYLNQGKVNQAIAEYQQILRNDPRDQATLMTVGDLFARQGDMSNTSSVWRRSTLRMASTARPSRFTRRSPN
jgi:Tfp pilus assembly protein PilF